MKFIAAGNKSLYKVARSRSTAKTFLSIICLVGLNILTCMSNQGVAEHANRVEGEGDEGDHLVPEEPQDLAGEDGEGDSGHGAHGQGEAHEELAGAQVLQVPEEEGLHAAPEDPRAREGQEEGEHPRAADDPPYLLEHLLGGRLEVEVELQEDHGGETSAMKEHHYKVPDRRRG